LDRVRNEELPWQNVDRIKRLGKVETVETIYYMRHGNPRIEPSKFTFLETETSSY